MATIKDVAKRAGVSVATVSRVLNKKGPLSDDAIARVKAAVAELRYSPNLLARSLASGRSSTLGVILPSFKTPIWSEMAQMIENCAKELGYRVIFSVESANSENRFQAVEYLKNLQVGGIIFCGSMWGDQMLQEQLKQVQDLPLALLLDQVEGLSCIVSDDAQGGVLAARHLIEKGCRNLVHVSADLSIYKHSDERSYSFEKECEKNGVSYRRYENHSSMPQIEETEQLIGRILEEFPETDGLFLKNDILAMECAMNLLSRGKKVPEDVKVIGYDDMFFSGAVYPPLTTIRHNYQMLAMTAIHIILEQIEGKNVPNLTVVPVELVERRSTGNLFGRMIDGAGAF